MNRQDTNLQDSWLWVSKLNLSRCSSSHLNYCDALLFLEIIHLHAPILVPKPELDRLTEELDSDGTGIQIWTFLTRSFCLT